MLAAKPLTTTTVVAETTARCTTPVTAAVEKVVVIGGRRGVVVGRSLRLTAANHFDEISRVECFFPNYPAAAVTATRAAGETATATVSIRGRAGRERGVSSVCCLCAYHENRESHTDLMSRSSPKSH